MLMGLLLTVAVLGQPCVIFADLTIVQNTTPELAAIYLRKWSGAIARATRNDRRDQHKSLLAAYLTWFDDRWELGLRTFADVQATPVPDRFCGRR